MNHKIYPLAYKLSPNQTCTLYYLGFPASWKTALLDIARKTNPKFKDEYGLPTNALKKRRFTFLFQSAPSPYPL